MNPWFWILIIAGGLILGGAFLMYLLPLMFSSILHVAEWFLHRNYARKARRHNEKARLLRLERTEWNGLPLPTGREGTLRLTYEQLVTNSNRFSQLQMKRAYEDRGVDLKVDLQTMTDPITRDIVIRWRPHKGRWPKERY